MHDTGTLGPWCLGARLPATVRRVSEERVFDRADG